MDKTEPIEVGLKIFTGSFGGALAVLAGVYGSGKERFEKLEKDGYNSEEVQDCVNDLINLIIKYGGNDFED